MLRRCVALSLLVTACLAVPPARAPEPAPPPADPVKVPIPTSAGEREPGALTQCPLATGRGQACGGGLGLVCTRDADGCERCECKPSPGTEGQTVDPDDMDPSPHP
jgi:hypothetical protein